MNYIEPMSIYTLPGNKVLFNRPMAGYPGDKWLAAEYLKEGTVYTVACTKIGSYHTTVYLDEVPQIGFNSCLFENVRS